MKRRGSTQDQPTKSQTTKRRNAYFKGQTAEHLAAMWLRAKGYKIIERRWTCKAGEIDILAWRNQTLIVVEVKARRTIDEAIQAVTWHNRQRIERAVQLYQGRHQRFSNDGLRFDIIAIAGLKMRHVRDAWRQY